MLLMGLFWEEKIGIARRIARASKLKQILGNVRCKNVDHTLGLAHQDVAMGMAENAGDSHDAPYSLAEHPRFSCGVRYRCSSGNHPHLTPILPLRILLILCNAIDHLSEYPSTTSASTMHQFSLASVSMHFFLQIRSMEERCSF